MYIYKITYLMERLPNYICITTIWRQFGIFFPSKKEFKREPNSESLYKTWTRLGVTEPYLYLSHKARETSACSLWFFWQLFLIPTRGLIRESRKAESSRTEAENSAFSPPLEELWKTPQIPDSWHSRFHTYRPTERKRHNRDVGMSRWSSPAVATMVFKAAVAK